MIGKIKSLECDQEGCTKMGHYHLQDEGKWVRVCRFHKNSILEKIYGERIIIWGDYDI